MCGASSFHKGKVRPSEIIKKGIKWNNVSLIKYNINYTILCKLRRTMWLWVRNSRAYLSKGKGLGGRVAGAGESFTAPRREIRGMMPQIITLRGHIHFWLFNTFLNFVFSLYERPSVTTPSAATIPTPFSAFLRTARDDQRPY